MSTVTVAAALRQILVGKVVQNIVVNGSAEEPVNFVIRTELGETVSISPAESVKNDCKLAFKIQILKEEELE